MTSKSAPAADYAGVPLPEVQILTNRLLSAETTEKVLNALDVIPNIRQINMTGESLPKTINSGPGKGLPNNHSERKVIHVGGQEVELRYATWSEGSTSSWMSRTRRLWTRGWRRSKRRATRP